MIDKKKDETLSSILENLKSQNLAIFCGAGISYNSGLPIVEQFLSYLYNKLELNDNERQSLLESNIPFESIIETLLMETEIKEIQNIFNEGTPNTNHLFIARLAKFNLLKIIYTTNFDFLLEKALELEGLTNGEEFKVYKTEYELKKIDWESNYIKIIKIHGCVTEKEEMAITLSQLASTKYLNLRENLLSQIFSSKICTSVLIMGYSCSDFDLVPIIDTLENPSSHIYFIEHHAGNLKEEPIHLKNEKNPFQKYTGTRIIVDTNNVVNQLLENLNLKLDVKSTLSITIWRDHIDAWFLNNMNICGIGLKHHINAKLLYGIGDNHNTIKHAQRSVEIALKNKNMKAYASELGTKGMALNRLGNYEEALECFTESLPIIKELEFDFNVAAQLQSFANVLHHMGKNEKAIINFKEALEIARRNDDLFSESNILGNMSNCYIELQQPLKAMYYIEKAIEFSQQIGNKQAESSQLGIKARIYCEMQKFHKAIETLKGAIDIKKMIADNNELCKLYLNLTSIYIMIENEDNAKNAAQECLTLSRYIFNHSLEKMILFIIKVNQLD